MRPLRGAARTTAHQQRRETRGLVPNAAARTGSGASVRCVRARGSSPLLVCADLLDVDRATLAVAHGPYPCSGPRSRSSIAIKRTGVFVVMFHQAITSPPAPRRSHLSSLFVAFYVLYAMSAPAWVNWNFGPTAGPVIMPPPSPYGALPGGNTSNLATLHGSTVFAFVGMNLTVLSCSVFGPYSTSTPHYQVISKSQGLDILETSLLEGGHQIGTIYWGGSTRVTLFNKSNPESHKAREWFVLSSDGV